MSIKLLEIVMVLRIVNNKDHAMPRRIFPQKPEK